MKVCTKCGEVNNNDSLICVNCNSPSKLFTDYEKETLSSEKNIDKQKRRKKNMIITLFTSSILLIVLLILLNFFNKTLSVNLIFETILFIVIGTVLIKFTEKIFVLTHIFSINDVNANQMSDMYDTYIKVIGGVSIFYSIIILIKPFLLE